jgi:hypothetical protein
MNCDNQLNSYQRFRYGCSLQPRQCNSNRYIWLTTRPTWTPSASWSKTKSIPTSLIWIIKPVNCSCCQNRLALQSLLIILSLETPKLIRKFHFQISSSVMASDFLMRTNISMLCNLRLLARLWPVLLSEGDTKVFRDIWMLNENPILVSADRQSSEYGSWSTSSICRFKTNGERRKHLANADLRSKGEIDRHCILDLYWITSHKIRNAGKSKKLGNGRISILWIR